MIKTLKTKCYSLSEVIKSNKNVKTTIQNTQNHIGSINDKRTIILKKTQILK